jgi:hypothetical protein
MKVIKIYEEGLESQVDIQLGIFRKSSSVKFQLRETSSFLLKVTKCRGILVAEMKGLGDHNLGFEAQLVLKNKKGLVTDTSDMASNLRDSDRFARFGKLTFGYNSIGKMKLCLKVKLCDFEFVCADKHFRCNNRDLVDQSRVFERMLTSNEWIESQTNTLAVDDFDTATVEAMVRFVTSQELPDDVECSNDLLKIADKYEITSLLTFCQEKLSSSLDRTNCFDMLDLTTFIDAKQLQESALSFIFDDWKFLSSTEGLEEIEDHKDLLKDFCRKKYTEIRNVMTTKDSFESKDDLSKLFDIVIYCQDFYTLRELLAYRNGQCDIPNFCFEEVLFRPDVRREHTVPCNSDASSDFEEETGKCQSKGSDFEFTDWDIRVPYNSDANSDDEY